MTKKAKSFQSKKDSLLFYYPFFLIPTLGLLAYANSFCVPFVFDDMRNIVNNPLIQTAQYFLSPNQAEIFPGYRDFMMRYMGFLSFALNYWIHGLNVFGYHVLNVLIHIVNAFSVYYLILLTARTPVWRERAADVVHPSSVQWIAFFAAAIFITHPIQSQAVSYIVQRFASLAAMFYLLALLTFMQWRLAPEKKWRYAASLVFALLAVKTKEIAFTLPFTILLYEWMFFQAPLGRRIRFLLPYGALSLIIPLSYLMTSGSEEGILQLAASQSKVLTDMPRSAYIFTELRVIVTYIRLLVFPVYQNFDYDYPVFHTFWNAQVILSFAFLAAIVASGVALYKKSHTGDMRLRLISFGVFWFFLTLLPESGLVPIVDVIYEHRLYLPSVGAFIAIAAALNFLLETWAPNPIRRKKFGWFAMIVIPLLLAVMTHQRNWVWQSEMSLWEDALRKSPVKIRVLTNLGSAYLENGSLDRAMELFQKAESLDPQNEVVLTNIATTNYKQSFVYRDRMMFEKAAACLDRAIIYYEKALSLNPKQDYLQKFLEGTRQERNRYILKKDD